MADTTNSRQFLDTEAVSSDAQRDQQAQAMVFHWNVAWCIVGIGILVVVIWRKG